MEINYSRENINQIIGNNIRYIRKSNKLSQEKFAEQVDLSPQFVSDVERGIEGISLITAIKICNVMNCSPLVSRSTNEDLNQRIVMNYDFKGLSKEDIRGYVSDRLNLHVSDKLKFF